MLTWSPSRKVSLSQGGSRQVRLRAGPFGYTNAVTAKRSLVHILGSQPMYGIIS